MLLGLIRFETKACLKKKTAGSTFEKSVAFEVSWSWRNKKALIFSPDYPFPVPLPLSEGSPAHLVIAIISLNVLMTYLCHHSAESYAHYHMIMKSCIYCDFNIMYH